MTAGNPAIVDVASVLARAERTTRRKLSEVAAEYGLAYPRWQTLRQRWRLALAALMLTLPDVTPDDVRREVAFASTATLCHALRRAGLPSPRAIQRAAADTRSTLSSAPHTHISADSRKSTALEPRSPPSNLRKARERVGRSDGSRSPQRVASGMHEALVWDG